MGAGGRSLPKAIVGLLLLLSGLGLALDIDPLRCCPGAKLDCLLGQHWLGIPLIHPQRISYLRLTVWELAFRVVSAKVLKVDESKERPTWGILVARWAAGQKLPGYEGSGLLQDPNSIPLKIAIAFYDGESVHQKRAAQWCATSRLPL